MAANGREIRRPVTEEDIRKWEEGWTDMMVKIWRENIMRLGIFDTGALHDSLRGSTSDNGGQRVLAHTFLLYGLYVARGVGNGYRRGNSGKDDENGLRFLGKAYRQEHKLGEARKKRDWFSGRYLRSITVLTRVERDLYGNAYMGTLSNVVSAMFDNDRPKDKVSATIRSF